QLAGEVEVRDLLGVISVCGPRRLQIVERRWGHAASGENVPRNALSATDADRLALRVGGHLKCAVDLGVVEVIGIALERGDVVIRAVQIIGPAIDHIALGTDDDPDVVVLVDGGSTSTLYVAATDLNVRTVAF